MSARTRSSSGNIWPASSRSNSARRARSPSAAAPAARASPASIPRPASAPQVAEGKEVKNFDGQDYILERGIRADLAIIKGWKADESGNLIFRKTARNFNQPMATAGKVCVAEVEEIVPVGSLDPGLHPSARHLCEAADPRRALRQEDRVPPDPRRGRRHDAFAHLAARRAARRASAAACLRAAPAAARRRRPACNGSTARARAAASSIQAYRALSRLCAAPAARHRPRNSRGARRRMRRWPRRASCPAAQAARGRARRRRDRAAQSRLRI